jgi:hypothetical protein
MYYLNLYWKEILSWIAVIIAFYAYVKYFIMKNGTSFV